MSYYELGRRLLPGFALTASGDEVTFGKEEDETAYIGVDDVANGLIATPDEQHALIELIVQASGGTVTIRHRGSAVGGIPVVDGADPIEIRGFYGHAWRDNVVIVVPDGATLTVTPIVSGSWRSTEAA